MKRLIFMRIALTLLLSLALCERAHSVAGPKLMREKSGLTKTATSEPMPSLHGQPAIEYLKERGLFESVKAAVELDRNELKWRPDRSSRDEGVSWQSDNTYSPFSDCYWAERRKALPSDLTEPRSQYGFSVSISGNTAIVGADGANGRNRISGTGAAYILERDQFGPNRWGGITKLVASDGLPGDHFGMSVGIDGDTAVVGAQNHSESRGAAYVYARKGGAEIWVEVKKLIASDGSPSSQFGSAVGISGDTILVGALTADNVKGAAYIFERNRNGIEQWGQAKKLSALDGVRLDLFGAAGAISGDTVIVGADGSEDFRGAAYIFQRNHGGADSWGQVKKLTGSDRASNDSFGVSVGISRDTAIVGAPGNNAFSGAAYVYERNRAGVNDWGELKKLTASGGQVGDQFGFSVGIFVDTAIAGAWRRDDSRGAAYIFGRNQDGTDTWGEVDKLTASDRARNDLFGNAVAISGDTAVIGALGFTQAIGSAYVFGCLAGASNTMPTINAATLSLTQGVTLPVSTIAKVDDAENLPGSLTVTVTSAPEGITITEIKNTEGTITANVAVACNATPGSNLILLQVQDSGDLTATTSLMVEVRQITLPPLPGGTAGTVYNHSAGALPAGDYLYSVTLGSLPPGLNLDPTTGLLSGTPNLAGSFAFTVTATGVCTFSRSYEVFVACPTLSITTALLPTGKLGVPYFRRVNVSPSGSYTFSVAEGKLPLGMILNPTTGVISKTPMVTGSHWFTVNAQAINGCTTTKRLSITITSPP